VKGSTSKRTNGQRGAALLLTLAALSIGSLIITPTIKYVYTGMATAEIAEEYTLDQYAADAALEYALWQIKYDPDGLLDGLNEENPSTTTSTNVNDVEVPIEIEITESPLGFDWPFPIPTSESGIHLTTVEVLGPPIINDEDETALFPHIIHIFNSGTSAVNMKSVFQRLDPRLIYIPGSFNGPENVFTETYVDDHWELDFDFTTPLPKLEAGEATSVSFMSETTEAFELDTYVGDGWVTYAAFGSDQQEVYVGEYEPGTVSARFDITITAGSYTILASVGITDDGEVVILSYQVL